MSSAVVPRPSLRLPLVDSLRALAALSIFAYHALFVTGRLNPGNYGWYLNVGVPLFYAISGLLLYRPFAAAALEATQQPSVSTYLRRRVFRIVPAYWLALPVVAMVLERSSQVFSLSGIPTYFGFLQIYSLDTFTGGIGQAWTLCVEATFYLFLPLWASLAAKASNAATNPRERARIQLLAIAVLALGSVAWKLAVIRLVGDDVGSALIALTALPAALDQFAVGMALAVVVAAHKISGEARLKLPGGPLAGLGLAALAYWLIGEVHGVGPVRSGQLFGWGGLSVSEHELKALVSFGLVAAAVSAVPGEGVIGRVLNFRPLRWTGEVSYGVYLWHLMILIVFAGSITMGQQVNWIGGQSGILGGPLGIAVAFALTLAVSWGSWQLVERRMIQRSHGS